MLLGLVATGFGVQRRNAAVSACDAAMSRELVSESERIRRSDPFTAAQLLATAWDISPTLEARASMGSRCGSGGLECGRR